MRELLFVAIGYLLGSIPFSYLMGRLFGGKDVRREGSGNVGATNVFRVAGRKAGIAAAAGDVGKSLLPVLGARLAGLEPPWVAATAAAVILGHCYPVWLGFRGGKGVNSTVAAFAVISFPSVLVFGAVWMSMFLLTGYVSLSSILATASLPLFIGLSGEEPSYVVFAVFTALFIAWRHHGNIRRLLDGTEKRMGRGKKGAR